MANPKLPVQRNRVEVHKKILKYMKKHQHDQETGWYTVTFVTKRSSNR